MAVNLGEISSSSKFSVCNHEFLHNRSIKSSPVMIKLPESAKFGASLTVRSSAGGDFFGGRVVFKGLQRGVHTQVAASSNAKMSIAIGKSLRWWEKGLQPNMKEIMGSTDLVDSLLNAGDQLVVVDFFSPGCGGCKALHPKICQLAELNPEVQFLQVNYEEHKSMCYSLNVHVLPFFRFYRGAHGRLCSFSCTNATIKKFKDALMKHKPDRCSLGPPKGLEEKELVALALNRDLDFDYSPEPESPLPVAEPTHVLPLPRPLESKSGAKKGDKDKTLVSFGR